LFSSFLDVFKQDPDVLEATADSFFDYGGSHDFIEIPKSNSEYEISTADDPYNGAVYRLDIVRREGEVEEHLILKSAPERFRGSTIVMEGVGFIYQYRNEETQGYRPYSNSPIALDAARTLLEKTKRDFQDAPQPNPANPQT